MILPKLSLMLFMLYMGGDAQRYTCKGQIRATEQEMHADQRDTGSGAEEEADGFSPEYVP